MLPLVSIDGRALVAKGRPLRGSPAILAVSCSRHATKCWAGNAPTSLLLAAVAAQRLLQRRQAAAAKGVRGTVRRQQNVQRKRGRQRQRPNYRQPEIDPEVNDDDPFADARLTAKQRFQQRQKQWASMYKAGTLANGDEMTRVASNYTRAENNRRHDRSSISSQLQRLAEAGQAEKIAARLPELWAEPWRCGVELLITMGQQGSTELKKALEALEEGINRGIGQQYWSHAAVALGGAALTVEVDSNQVVNMELAEAALGILSCNGAYRDALKILVEFATADAQKAANLLARIRELRKRGSKDEGEIEKNAAEAEECFQKAMQKVGAIPQKAVDWGLTKSGDPALVARGVGLAREGWDLSTDTRSRWNKLVRLIAKRRNMDNIFQILFHMRDSKIRMDHETYEFVARAAVATVQLTSLADSFQSMPPPQFPEIVFVGWSNVGKSSLVNSVLHRKALAPVSTMPGKTTQFHFYTINARRAAFPQMTIVDVPGLGEAMTDHATMRHWKNTLYGYLRLRGPMLRMVFHLISAEVLLNYGQPSQLDASILKLANRNKMSYTIVLTKIDLLTRGEDVAKVSGIVRNLVKSNSKAAVIVSSVRSCTGRDLLWKRLWRAVDPNKQPSRSAPSKLAETQQKLDQLVAACDADGLTRYAYQARESREFDIWEYAVRCLTRIGLRRRAWALVQESVGLKKTEEAEEMSLESDNVFQEREDDDKEEQAETMRRFLLDLQEDLEERSQEEQEQSRNTGCESLEAKEYNSQEYVGGDDFSLPKLKIADERAALCVGEAALSWEPTAGDQIQIDEKLASEVWGILSSDSGSQSSAVELMLEWVVSDVRQGVSLLDSSSGQGEVDGIEPQEATAAFERAFSRLDELLRCVEDWGCKPWSLVRWSQLLRWMGRRQDFASIERVLDAMASCGIKGGQETDRTMTTMAVTHTEFIQQAPEARALTDVQDLPEVILLGTFGVDANAGPGCFGDAVVTTVPRRKVEDEIDQLSGTRGKKEGKSKGSTPKSHPNAKLFRLNVSENGQTFESAAMPPLAVIDVPAVQRPSVEALAQEMKPKIQDADAGVWGGSSDGDLHASSAGSAWMDDVCDLLTRPRPRRLAGVFHVIDARDFAMQLRREVPASRSFKEPEHEATGQGLTLSADDKAVQEASLRACPQNYVLVVADSSLLAGGGRIQAGFCATVPVVMERRERLLRFLQHEAEAAAAAACPAHERPNISVLLADKEQFYRSAEFTRRLWQCAAAPSHKI